MDSSLGEEAKLYVERVLEREGKEPRGKVLMATIAGSVSYNVHKDLSDKDFFGVYAAPLPEVLALGGGVKETVNASAVGGDDFCVHEAAKFGRLLLKGNPGIVEALYNDGDVYSTPAWDALRAQRDAFLSQSVVFHYLGYIKSQLKQYAADKGVSTKKLYHVIRLLGEVERIASGGHPVVRMQGEERDRLMAIRANEEDPEAILEEAQARIAAVKAGKPWGLPPSGDEDVLMAWLIDLRRGVFDEDE